MPRLKLIREFAETMHGKQMYGERPYIEHLDHVVDVLRRFGITDNVILCAGYLHDVLEDTEVALDELRGIAGEEVAAMVDACTDGEGPNRKARKERVYQMIPQHPRARMVKIADRIANIEASLAHHHRHRGNLVVMYRKEQAEFRRRLTEKLPQVEGNKVEAMFNYIDQLLR